MLLQSLWLMVTLFILMAAAMGVATFIEHDSGSNTARILIYNSWWFEGLMLLFIVNFFSNIKRYALTYRTKLPVLLVHLSLVLIILGAFISRYYGFEGLMSIREGQRTREMLIDKAHLNVTIEKPVDNKLIKQSLSKPLLLSQHTPRQNSFSIETHVNNQKIEIEYLKFIENASNVLLTDELGENYLKIVSVINGKKQDIYIKEGEVVAAQNGKFALNRPTKDAVNFLIRNESLFVLSPFNGSVLNMASKESHAVTKDRITPLALKSLYTINEMQFVVPEELKKGTLTIESNNAPGNITDDALQLKIKIATHEKVITVFGNKQKIGIPITELVGGYKFTISYGGIPHNLPFNIELQKFTADKYPGTTNSYAGFRSDVQVSDPENIFEAAIFMNHVLDYKGYRFFQASFHPDEQGTILAVNHDRVGTWVTYIGYFSLFLGLLMILFSKHTRFGIITNQLRKLEQKSSKKFVICLFLFSLGYGHAQKDSLPHKEVQQKLDSIVLKHRVPEQLAMKFGSLVIQDIDGRMMPINTFSSEILRKISKQDHYLDLNSDQVFISMIQFPEIWYNIPLVYVKQDNDSLRSVLGIKASNKHIPLSNFFKEDGSYKLTKLVNTAYMSAVPNQFEKDFIEVDKRVNLFYNNLSRAALKLFPVPNDPNNKWIAPTELQQHLIPSKDSLFISQIIPLYASSLNEAQNQHNYDESNFLLNTIEKYQLKYGTGVRPSDSQIKAEIAYNKYDIFKKLFSWYLYAGVLMLISALLFMFQKNKILSTLVFISKALIYVCFFLHSLGLVMRWYVSGHAPWSDAYESIIYISWATMLFGLILGRKSKLTLAVTSFVVSMILMVAHWNWLDPSIANLQPVLNSYWLMIHVAIIVASYGPFAIGMILGFLSLVLMTFLHKKNHEILKLNIKKLLLINESALTIGLVLLTIGNFLGAMWANESWGRYWAWDPKETWALISILLYALIIHLRLLPKLKGKWLFALVSVVAFYSILMTYFGVNFYLSGLHSYAKGDNIVTPGFVYYSIALITIVAIIAYRKQLKFKL